MELNQQKLGEVSVVSITGSIDALTAGEVQQYFDQLTGSGERSLLVDLAHVDFMSSAGLRVIMAISKDVRQRGGDLRIAAAQPPVEKMLKISGFTSVLKSFPSVDQAVQSFQGG